MLKSKSRRGRPIAVYRPKIGDPVVGLMRLSDGRWRASGPEKYTFTEPDPGLAIAHFREWEARKTISNLGLAVAHDDFNSAFRDTVRRAVASGGNIRTELGTPRHNGKATYIVTDDTLNPAQWAWLRRQIIDRPKWVAERVGIEKIGYLKNLKGTRAIADVEGA